MAIIQLSQILVGKKFQTLKVEDVFDVSLFWGWKPLIKYNLVFSVSLVNKYCCSGLLFG